MPWDRPVVGRLSRLDVWVLAEDQWVPLADLAISVIELFDNGPALPQVNRLGPTVFRLNRRFRRKAAAEALGGVIRAADVVAAQGITCLLPLNSCIPFVLPVAALLPTASSARGWSRPSGRTRILIIDPARARARARSIRRRWSTTGVRGSPSSTGPGGKCRNSQNAGRNRRTLGTLVIRVPSIRRWVYDVAGG